MELSLDGQVAWWCSSDNNNNISLRHEMCQYMRVYKTSALLAGTGQDSIGDRNRNDRLLLLILIIIYCCPQ